MFGPPVLFGVWLPGGAGGTTAGSAVPVAAQRVFRALQAVQAMGRTVICTLHQPSPEAFAALHRVMVLQAGRLVFFGEPAQVPGPLLSAFCGSAWALQGNHHPVLACSKFV